MLNILDLAEQANQQHYPQGALYMVATPIGNIADFSHRAIAILNLADTIVCEDTRHSGALLSRLGIKKTLLAYHQHSEHSVIDEIIKRIENQQRVVYISDAGTPAISDPGAKLVNAAQKLNLKVVPIGGISAVTTLLSVAGEGFANYYFAGFLPPKTKAMQDAVLRLWQMNQQFNTAIVLYEASHRIVETLSVLLERFSAHRIVCGRELTKQFEELIVFNTSNINTSNLNNSDNILNNNINILNNINTKGEFCIAISQVQVQVQVQNQTENNNLNNNLNNKNNIEEYHQQLSEQYPKIALFYKNHLEALGTKTASQIALNFLADNLYNINYNYNNINNQYNHELSKKVLYDWALFLQNK